MAFDIGRDKTMALDTLALLRFFIIDQQLRRTPESTTEDLRVYVENEINIITGRNKPYSMSTLKRDIRTMKCLLAAPIVFSFTKNRYEFIGKSHIMELPQLASEYFCNYLRMQLLREKQPYEVLQYQERSIAGNNHLFLFIKAIISRKQISFMYKPFDLNLYWQITMSPIQITEERSAWFVVGVMKGKIEQYALYRIERAPVILEKKSAIPVTGKDILLDKTIRHEIKIVLNCTPEIRAEVVEHPFHKSQRVVWNTVSLLRVTIRLFPDESFFARVMSYQGKVKIIRPDSLRSIFANRLQAMLDEYSGCRA